VYIDMIPTGDANEVLTHYTLNTGQTRQSPRSEVDERLLPLLAPFASIGRHELPKPFLGFTVAVSGTAAGLFLTIHRGDVPLVSCAVADAEAAADEVWPPLERLYLRITEGRLPFASEQYHPPRRPERLPWLAVVLVGPSDKLLPAADWLADFERCLAWAWLASREGN
jgi:hypothetical protein